MLNNRSKHRLLFWLPILSFVLVVACAGGKTNTGPQQEKPEEKNGWYLGAQAYTFRKFTFADALAKIDSCGLGYVEAYTRQKIGEGFQDSMFYTMSERSKLKVKQLLLQKGVRWYAYGVVKAKDEQEWRKVFSFCSEMGVQIITCEPEKKHLDIVSALCDEFKINAAIHNHPKPSAYWHPDTVLQAIKGRSSRLGACADIGHWVRSGLNPVECLEKLNGHIRHLHFKDLNEKNNRNAHDVVWGKGVCDVNSVIATLKKQRFKGMISAEYEYNWDNNVPDVAASVSYFRTQSRLR